MRLLKELAFNTFVLLSLFACVGYSCVASAQTVAPACGSSSNPCTVKKLKTTGTGNYPVQISGTAASGISIMMPIDTYIYWSSVNLGLGYLTSRGLATNANLISNAGTGLGTSADRWSSLFLSARINITASDSTASPGNATLNTSAGKSAIDVASTATTITSSQITANSIVMLTPTVADASCGILIATISGSTFTATCSVGAAGAIVKFNWLIIN